MSGAVRSGCVVVEAMQTADKYLRVLIFALLMKQLDFELYTKHLDGDGRAVQAVFVHEPPFPPFRFDRVFSRLHCIPSTVTPPCLLLPQLLHPLPLIQSTRK
jgi:hypothetical protein